MKIKLTSKLINTNEITYYVQIPYFSTGYKFALIKPIYASFTCFLEFYQYVEEDKKHISDLYFQNKFGGEFYFDKCKQQIMKAFKELQEE